VPDTARSAVAVDTWTSFVKAGFGALGFGLLAVAPLVPRHTAFAALPLYCFVVGGLLVVLAATMRLRAMLIVLGCIGLTAALACTLASGGDARLNESALSLYCGAAVVWGAVGRRAWMALPFLLVPLLIVAPGAPAGWSHTREDFAVAWHDSLGCDCLWAGLPAALAIAGAIIGEFRRTPWPFVRPSALPVLIACAGVLMASLVLGSLLPDSMAFARTICWRAALLAGVLAWVALAYQVGRLSFVWEAALACLLVLGGAVWVNEATQELDTSFLVTIAASLVPAVLAGLGLLVRKWIGTERPRPEVHVRKVDLPPPQV